MKTFSKACLALCLAALPSFAMASPAAAADASGCVTTYADAATSPGPSPYIVVSNPKFWLSDGIHIYPANVVPWAEWYTSYQAGAASAFVTCLI